jgi:hypothetical protein
MHYKTRPWNGLLRKVSFDDWRSSGGGSQPAKGVSIILSINCTLCVPYVPQVINIDLITLSILPGVVRRTVILKYFGVTFEI